MERIGSLIGPYRIKRLIGSGGMGDVFAAVHEQLGQEVALKLLKPEVSEDRQLVGRFLQEGQALARFDHPGVVRVLHCGQLEDGTLFLAMELLQGLSLREWIRLHPGPVLREEALAVGRQIAEVMAEVHEKGIIHRDLKPENVFLCPDQACSPGYRVKLLDFGIAKAPLNLDDVQPRTQVQTRAPALLGTPMYMAPEQLRDAAKADAHADVYSLGVLLFELLAGRPPFKASSPFELISMHARDVPPYLRELVPTTPGALSSFIASMLAKTPAERPSMLRCQERLGRRWADGEDECPVPGLAAFSEAQAELFFGRQVELDEVLGLLEEARRGRQRWVQLEGPSGVGKSSLVQAGLLPRLKQHAAQSTPGWRILCLTPSHSPVRGLALALHAAYADTALARSVDELEAWLHADPEALRTVVEAHTPPTQCLLFILEQVEELFTLEGQERLQLDGLVSAALVAPAGQLRLLTTLRSDFTHRLDQLPRLSRQLNDAARYTLRPLEGAALRQAIEGMAQRAGLRLSEGLPERMVQDAVGEGSRLPLLAHTLRGLWMMGAGALLTHEHYKQLGGVEGALARQAEQLLGELGDKGRGRAKWLLLDMVQVSRGTPALRRSRSRQEVLAAAGGDALAEEVLCRLSGMRAGPEAGQAQLLRLVAVSGGPEPSRQRVDLMHEALLQQVPSMVGWIAEERARLERSADLEAAAHTWEQAGRPPDGLPTGTLLEHYRQAAMVVSPQGLQLFKASAPAVSFLGAAARLDRRRQRVRWTAMAVGLAALAAILLSAGVAVFQRQRAEEKLRQSIAFTDEFVSKVDWELGWHAHTLTARMQLFKSFDKILEGLSAQDLDTIEVQRVIAKTWQRRADMAFHDETLEASRNFLGRAAVAIERGLVDSPEDWDLNFRRGLNSSKLGKVAQAQRQWVEARAHFTTAIELFKRLQPKDEPDDRRTRATSDAELAALELEAGDTVGAARLYGSAINLLERNQCSAEQISKKPNLCLYDHSLLVEALGDRARVAQAAGDNRAAAEFFQRAEQEGFLVSSADPGSAYARWVRARVLIGAAQFHVSQQQPEAALRRYQEAQTLGLELHQGEPVNKRYALALVESLRGRETLERLQGSQVGAARLHEERCALIGDFRRQDPDDPRFASPDCP